MNSTPRTAVRAAFALLAASGLFALQQPTAKSSIAANSPASRALLRQRPLDANVPQPLAALQAQASANPALAKIVNAWSDAASALGPRTIVYLDLRSGGAIAVEPDGLPWIPGTGVNNRLTRADLAPYMTTLAPDGAPTDPPDANGVTDAVLERIARAFMARHPEWFPVAQDQLVRMPAIADPGHFVRHVRFGQFVNGVPVEDASLTFHIGHGNLLSFGGQYLSTVRESAIPAVGQADARNAAYGYAGVTDAAVSEVGKPVLKFVIVDDKGAVAGAGYRHRLVHQITFRVKNEPGTWQAEVDAQTGAVVRFEDINDYGTIVGGVQPLSNDGVCPSGCEQPGYPMPFADTGTANVFTDTGGNYTQTTGTVTTTLAGKYVRCLNTGFCSGAISESIAAPGNMDLGISGGTDCTVPAGHSAGDTHAARDAFYNVNKLKEEVRGWLPTWTFNNNQVTVNVNLNQTCNAYWNGVSLNMFKSSASCRNTGEIAMIFDHELGHGYDANDGGGSARPGEAYADNTASIHHHDSCIGRGFFTGTGKCGGYGNACTVCSGVRDVDWTRFTNSRPKTVALPTGTAACPAGSDICNWETHCASYPLTTAVWDAATIDLPHNAIPTNGGAACAGTSPGNPTTPSQAWTLMSRLWWKSVGSLSDQYSCTTAGTAGCGVNNTFHNLKVNDDDDGNLANGTPHAAELQCAFGRHQTGCTTDNNVDFTTCPALLAPTVTPTAGNSQVVLNWTAVTNATKYRVFRNEESCGAGYSLIATVTAPTLTYTDNNLLNGRTYYYQVQPIAGASDQCDGQPSACASATPQPCVTPGVPTIGTVTAPANNDLRVSWTNGSPAASKFNVYRATGTCAAPGAFSKVGNQVAASPYDDLTVSGGATYAFKVTGTDSTGLCESAQSGCAQGTATGTCTLPPTFAGATSATNSAQSTCTVGLTWAAGTKQCAGASNTVTYNIYRSTTSGFTPAAGNRIATGVTGTSYSDAIGISNGVTYYYIVHAVDSLGNEDTNTVQVSAAPTGAASIGTWTDDAGDTGTAKMTLNAPWSVAAAGGNLGPKVYQTGTYANNACVALVTPSLVLGTNATLSFSSHYDTELNYDKGLVQISNNGGTTWATVPVNYPATSTQPGDACGFGAVASFTGTNATYATYTGSLATWNNQTVLIRWSLSSDVSITGTGWWVDDVSITNVNTPAACSTGAARPPEVTPTGAATAMKVSKGSTAGTVVLNFADMAGATGYNVYEGALPMASGNPYTHGTTGNVCAAATTLAAGRRSTAAAGIGTAGSHYYVVTQYTTAEGPSGFNSSAVEIDPTKSTCAP